MTVYSIHHYSDQFFWRWALIKLVGAEWEIERCKDRHCTNGGRVIFTEYLEYDIVDLKPILRIRPAQVEDDRYKWNSPRNQVCHLCTY